MNTNYKDGYDILITNLNNENYLASEILAKEFLTFNPKDITALKVLIYININTFNFEKAISLVDF